MITNVLPLLIYLASFPVMLAAINRVEIGLLFFISIVPIISLMQKVVMFPMGNNVVDLLLLSMCFGWLLNASRDNRKLFISSPLNVIVLLVIIGSAVNLVRGYTYMDLPEDVNLERLRTWKNYLILPLIYFIGANNVETEAKIRRILICISATMLAMVGNFYTTLRWYRTDHFSQDVRISGPFGFLGPGEIGIFFAMYSLFLLGISYYVENKKLKYLFLLVSACSIYPVLFTYTRSAYMCLVGGLLVLGLLRDRRFLVLVISLPMVYHLLLPASVVERIDMSFVKTDEVSQEQERLSGFEMGNTSVLTGRKHLWDRALWYFGEQPILGIGFDTFRHNEGMITHSTYMKILAEQGLVGVVIYVFFMGVTLKQAYRLFRESKSGLRRGVGLGFLLCITAHLVGSTHGDQTLYYNMMAIYWLFLGIVARLNVESEGEIEKSSSPVEASL